MSQILDYTLPEHLAARQSARRREGMAQIIAGTVALSCLIGAAFLVNPINRIRKDRQYVIDPDSTKGLPPNLALLSKIGTVRALVIDWAAIRAERLKNEGKTYEAFELYDTICTLAPRFPRVWVNAAWNMAYNISVMQYSPEARWRWVKNGIELLRDRGIQFNPKAVTLYKEIAWIYWHKIGDFMDDEHLNYKRALAVEMERVLGPPPVTLSDKGYFDWFAKMVNASRDLTILLTEDAEIAQLVGKLDGVSLAPDQTLLDFVARNIRPELQASALLKVHQEADPLAARRLAIITDPASAEPLDRLLAAVRSQVLREDYKLDLDWMFDLMLNQYGPLDWRNAFSHALYWASWGDKVSRGYEAVDRNEQLNNARFVFYALQQTIMRGHITLWPNFDTPFTSYIELTPDTRYIPYLYDAYMRLGKEHFGDDPRFVEGTPGPIYGRGFVAAMQEWIQLLYLEGGEANLAQAEVYLTWLRDNNPHPDGSMQPQYTWGVNTFVLGELLSTAATYKAAAALVRGFAKRGLKQFSLGMGKQGVHSLKRGRSLYEYWMADSRNDFNDRRKMPPFILIVRDEVENYLKNPGIAPLYKARLWLSLLRDDAAVELARMSYDHLSVYFQRLCEAQDPPWDPAVAFEPPPGLDEFRKRQGQDRAAPRREDVDQGTSKPK